MPHHRLRRVPANWRLHLIVAGCLLLATVAVMVAAGWFTPVTGWEPATPIGPQLGR